MQQIFPSSTNALPANNKISASWTIRRVIKIYMEQIFVLIPIALPIFFVAGVLETAIDRTTTNLSLLSLPISVVSSALLTGMVVQLVALTRTGCRHIRPRQ